MRVLHNLAIAALLLAAAAPLSIARAQDAAWKVTSLQGVVRVSHSGHASEAAYANEILPNGATLTTGAESRATLENGLQSIEVASHSRMTIARDSTAALTRIIEDFGYLLFKVDHRGEPHFRVDTPLLAAIVKGTTFSVSTDPREDMVHVVQGLVQIQLKSGGNSDVATGGTGVVLRSDPDVITMPRASGASRTDARASALADGASAGAPSASLAPSGSPVGFMVGAARGGDAGAPLAVRLTDVLFIVVVMVVVMFAGRAVFSRFVSRPDGPRSRTIDEDRDAASRRQRR
jgi:ferric-dicitrate binding protein FerR (iron transport regulator)